MSYMSLLDCVGTVKRPGVAVDEFGTPQPNLPAVMTTVGAWPCAVTRQTITSKQGEPMVESGISYRLYFPAAADVREGDLVVVPGHGQYELASPYRPRGHHIEVDGRWEGEA